MSGVPTGFIGLGSQGGPMAERMLQHFPLTVWARRVEVTDAFAAKGATVAPSIEALGAACEHVGVCVVNDDDVRQVCAVLIPAMRPGSLLAVHSTVLPETVAALEAPCAAAGVRLIDSPVSGGQPGAQAGTMTVMCGGTTEAFEQARPVFESFAKLIVHLGEAGSGQRAKIINNTLLSAHMGLAAAALDAGETLGIARSSLAELIKQSSGRSFGFEVYSRIAAPGQFRHGAELLLKDARLLAAIMPDDENAARLVDDAMRFLGPETSA